ncbi:hypothetical protein [Pseudonocardia sp. MH-G8]|nr:hypothetical protein [Pseudonocardia sp. MH-G8]
MAGDRVWHGEAEIAPGVLELVANETLEHGLVWLRHRVAAPG